jgi:hypothetical protein
VAWIFFRAHSFADAMQAIEGFVLMRSPGRLELGLEPLAVLGLLAGVHWVSYRLTRRAGDPVASRSIVRRAPAPLFALGYGIVVAVVLALVPASYKPFIYFQF